MGGGCTKVPKNECKIVTYTASSHCKGTTNETVRLQLLNDTDNTSWIELDKFLRNDFKKGSEDTFKRVLPDNENIHPTAIKLDIKGNDKESEWLCDRVHVHKDGKIVEFPVYDWITQEEVFFTGKVLLSFHNMSRFEKDTIAREIDRSKSKYGWKLRPRKGEIGYELPRYVNDSDALPLMFKRSDQRQKELFSTGLGGILNAGLEVISGLFFGLDELDDFHKLYEHLKPDRQIALNLDNWKTDEEFGRQQLNGITPLSFERCNGLPSTCVVRDEHLEGCGLEDTLENEIKGGRIFIADYSTCYQGVLRNSHADGKFVCPDALCLYRVNKDDNLVPICIQLEPNSEESIFTPKDSPLDWLLAKMYFKVAMANYHEWCVHFLRTHNVVEPVGISMFRCLPRCHPLYKVLRQHVETSIAINTDAREVLIVAGSFANNALAIDSEEFIRKCFKTFKWEDLVIPEVIKKRGLDSSYLSKFYYRDDALEHWRAQETYMRDVLSLYYKSDQDVRADEHLQDFVDDMGTEGFAWLDGNKHGIPDKFTTLDQLVQFATTVMFTSSVQHAAINFPQFEHYKFIPNFPSSMRKPIHKKGEATMERIMASLPDQKAASIQVVMTYVLSGYSEEEEYVGSFNMKLFNRPEPFACQEKYRMAMTKLGGEIAKRNSKLDCPYEFLYPDRIPNSIAI